MAPGFVCFLCGFGSSKDEDIQKHRCSPSIVTTGYYARRYIIEDSPYFPTWWESNWWRSNELGQCRTLMGLKKNKNPHFLHKWIAKTLRNCARNVHICVQKEKENA